MGWSSFHLAASMGELAVLEALVAAAQRAPPATLEKALAARSTPKQRSNQHPA